MKKILICAAGLGLLITSCKKNLDDAQAPVEKNLIPGATVDTLIGHITVNTTLTKATYLEGVVFVDNGVTLTVNPGVTIKGSDTHTNDGKPTLNLDSFQYNKGTLIVERGGKLVANGTATQPIVWTSNKPAGSRAFGDWGGIILLGNSTTSSQTGTSVGFYEAFFNDPLFQYGGTNAADNSGSIQYNRIEFAGGIVTKPNAEVNGLTLCGVGTGTRISHVEVMHSGDDGYEFFGGTVNVDHLLSFGSKDDDFDFDEGYNGRVQFIIAYRTALGDNSGSEFIELDNNAAGTAGIKTTKPWIANATFVGPTAQATGYPTNYFDGGVYVRRAGRIVFANSLVIGQAEPNVVAATPTTRASFDLPKGDAAASVVAFSIFQNNGTDSVVTDTDDKNPLAVAKGGAATNDAGLLAKVKSLGCTFVNAFADFKLDGALTPAAGSPALSGGYNLSSFGFVGTTQRGGVITTDKWTSTGWLSTRMN